MSSPLPPTAPLPKVRHIEPVTNTKGGDFGRAIKWGTGLALSCGTFGCFTLVLIFLIIFGLGSIFSGQFAPNIDDIIINERILSDGGEDKIVKININGEIIDNGNVAENADASLIVRQLEMAGSDEKVKAVVLSVNSPGGGLSPSVKIYDKVKELKNNGKKVVVSMEDVAASGGYYISAPADKIFANKTTWTGSIGVIMTLPNLEGLFDKYGYKEIVIKSGDLKDMGSWSRKMTEEETVIFQLLVDEGYSDFVKVVAEGRNMTEDKVRQAADGRIYTAKQAKELGLIDEVGGFKEAEAAAKKIVGSEDATVVEYSVPPSFFQEIAG